MLRIIDECSRFSVAGIIADKSPDELCRRLRHWWFKRFQPPRALICDQEGAVATDAVGCFIQRFEVIRKLKVPHLWNDTMHYYVSRCIALRHKEEKKTLK